ncbi:hypothetical protein [Serratia liquefaciens]|uniref:hypothetical protein n=1 Tax=Serratia liquefaciens TaxID=614 RepID=UPI0035244375
MRKRLGISKTNIVPKNKGIVIHEDIKKQLVRITEYESIFKMKLKSSLKKGTLKLQQKDAEQVAKHKIFKPK